MTNSPSTIAAADLAQVTGGQRAGRTTGDDTIITSRWGNQSDDVLGGPGNDLISTGGGTDYIDGGSGNDTINGGGGVDVLRGGDGNDVISGGWNDHAGDMVEGGAGDDRYIWNPTNGLDNFEGGEGNDMILVTGISQHDLETGLDVSPRGLTMQVKDGVVSFVNAHGETASVSGTLRLGGYSLTFQNVESFKVV